MLLFLPCVKIFNDKHSNLVNKNDIESPTEIQLNIPYLKKSDLTWRE